MSEPKFTAVIDTVPPETEAFVVCLGRPEVLPALEHGKILVVDPVTEAAVEQLARLDPALLSGGVVLVTTRAAYADHPHEVVRAQKILAYLFMKFVLVPLRTTRVPDPLALRPSNTPPEYLHLLNLFRNTPLHLRHGLIDKVRQAKVGLPCLLLLPGPSLTELAPWLPELARRYLLVTISRTLPFLRECGVTPDVLMQLDTVPLQEHFHHPDDRFPEGVLFALSMAPITGFASRFRHVFFIDSFDLAVLPNPARIRESWLSSMLACLGCAEALGAPKVLLAGADLRYLGRATYHGDQRKVSPEAVPPHDDPLTCRNELVLLADAMGRRATTCLQYFATAAEAELFARDMGAASGTEFYNLSSWTLLDPAVYAPLSAEAALAAPELDRRLFRDRMDTAASQAERINLRSLRARYSGRLSEAKRNLQVFSCLCLTDAASLPEHPYYRYIAANVPWFRPQGEAGLTRLAANLARELVAATRFARNCAALFLRASMGRPLAVLCTGEEEAAALRQLGRHHPGWTWQAWGIVFPGTERPAPSGGVVELARLHDWLEAQEVVVVAPGFAAEYHYALSLVAGDNVIELEAVAASD